MSKWEEERDKLSDTCTCVDEECERNGCLCSCHHKIEPDPDEYYEREREAKHE